MQICVDCLGSVRLQYGQLAADLAKNNKRWMDLYDKYYVSMQVKSHVLSEMQWAIFDACAFFTLTFSLHLLLYH